MNIMKKVTLFTIILSIGLILAGCGSSGSSASQQGGSNVINSVATINMGNISTIPVGNGSSGQSSVTITNNLKNTVALQSATYILSQDGTTSAPVNATGTGSLINVSQCSSLPGQGTCSINIAAPSSSSQGQFVVNLQFIDLSNQKIYNATNIIPYSDQVQTDPNGMFRYSLQNNNIYNQIGGSTTMTIPFQLVESFSSLTASVSNLNPAFSTSISCPGNSYTAGSLCNLYVKVSNAGTSPIINGNILINGVALNVLDANNLTLNRKNVQVASGYQLGLPVTVIQNNVGNLITSALNVVESANVNQTITLLNNGAVTISNISLTQGSALPITINNNTCNSLSPGASCSFDISSNSPISGQNYITVNYNNVSGGGITSSLSFNIIYIASSSSPLLTLTSGQGNLNNVVTNTSVYYNILVNNSGAATLNNITFTNPTTQHSAFTWDNSSTCDTSGNQTLSPGQQCTLVLKYSPSVIESGNLTINAAGIYTGQGGESLTYNAANLGLSYSAITGDAFLYITPNYVSFAIRADGKDSESQTFKVVNAGLQSTKIDSVALPSIPGFVNLNTGTCAIGQTLNINESCTINTTFGPESTALPLTESELTVGYKPNASYASDVYAFSVLDFSSSLAALINVSNVTVTGVTGSGTSESPYIFTNSPAAHVLLTTVTYTNNGSANATNFNVALNNLPIGYAESVTASKCPTGIAVATLNVSSSCSVSFYAVNPNGRYNPYTINGTGLGFNIPGYSYQDASTGLNVNPFPVWSGNYGNSNNIYVTTNLFATVTTTSPSWTTGNAGGTNNFTFTSPNNGTVITIPDGQLNGFTLGSKTCTITAGNCSIPITNPIAFPLGKYYFDYYVTPAGISVPSSTNSIIQNGSFTFTN